MPRAVLGEALNKLTQVPARLTRLPAVAAVVTMLLVLAALAGAEAPTAPKPAAAAPALPVAATVATEVENDAGNEELRWRLQMDRAARSAASRTAAAPVAPTTAPTKKAAPVRAANPAPAAPRAPAATTKKPANVPPAAGNAGAVVTYARAQVGKRYVFATSGPNTFDCSGLVVAAYRQIGISLPHQTGGLAGRGRAVSRSQLQPGDLVFPDSGHVGIYVGGNMMVHASNPRTGVKLSSVYAFSFARRIL